MTAVEVVFQYGSTLTESTMRAIDDLREVYGIRRIRFNETDSTLLVEYDATRLNENNITTLLRQAGLDLIAKLSLT
jgi:hypothetical protein